jgi:hypothetical protein
MQTSGSSTAAQTTKAAQGMTGLNEAELRLLRARLQHATSGPFELTQPYALWHLHRQPSAAPDGTLNPLDEIATFGRSEDADLFLDTQRLLPRLLDDYERLRLAERAALPKGA